MRSYRTTFDPQMEYFKESYTKATYPHATSRGLAVTPPRSLKRLIIFQATKTRY